MPEPSRADPSDAELAGAPPEDPGIPDVAPPEVNALGRKRRVVLAVAIGAVLLGAGGLGASLFVKSPAQAAAEAAPPAPDVLTARVEERVLRDSVVTRGTVMAEQTLDIAPGVASGEDAGEPVVTRLMVREGQSFRAGKPLAEVSGRPVFTLPGSLPVYRDLKPGSHGKDVAQLQRALGTLGYEVGADEQGRYGDGTKAAVAALYAAMGYEPVGADGADEAADAAAEAVSAAERAWEEAKDGGEPDSRQVRYARQDLDHARARLTAARARQGAMVPASEVVVLTSFPARVDTVAARIGKPVGDRLMTVSSGELIVTGLLERHEKGLVHEGQKVEVYSESTGKQVRARISEVSDELSAGEASADTGDSAGTEGGGAAVRGYAFEARAEDRMPVSLAGQDVRLTIQAAASKGRVLVVPVSAISSGADARTTVTVLRRGGEQQRIEVRPGISGDGYVQVTPESGGRLAAGDEVVVGVADQGDGAAKGKKGGSGRSDDGSDTDGWNV